jgi:hypothetical protein
MKIAGLVSSLLFLLVATIDASPVAAADNDNDNPRVPQTQQKGVDLNSDVAGAGCGDAG